MRNPLRGNKKYLRKKTDLVKDYLLAGTFLLGLGMFVRLQYLKINPPDPVEQ